VPPFCHKTKDQSGPVAIRANLRGKTQNQKEKRKNLTAAPATMAGKKKQNPKTPPQHHHSKAFKPLVKICMRDYCH